MDQNFKNSSTIPINICKLTFEDFVEIFNENCTNHQKHKIISYCIKVF